VQVVDNNRLGPCVGQESLIGQSNDERVEVGDGYTYDGMLRCQNKEERKKKKEGSPTRILIVIILVNVARSDSKSNKDLISEVDVINRTKCTLNPTCGRTMEDIMKKIVCDDYQRSGDNGHSCVATPSQVCSVHH